VERLTSEEQSRLNLLSIVPDITNADGERPTTPLRKLYEVAGVKTLDKDFFQILMSIKRSFRDLEKSLRVSIANKVEKLEWDTPKRYKAKIRGQFWIPISTNSNLLKKPEIFLCKL